MSGTSVKLISALDSVTSVSPSDLIPVTQGSTGAGTGTTRKATLAQISGVSTASTNVITFGAVPDGQKAIVLVSIAAGQTALTVSLPSAWAGATAYTTGQVRTNNGFAFVCVIGGTSGGTGPLYRNLNGAPIVDGTVTWNCLGVAASSASLFSAADVGKSINVIRLDVVNGWCPWWGSTVGYTAVPTITGYTSPTSIQVSAASSAAPTGSPTFPTQSWPYSSTPALVMWGTDNSAALQTALAAGGEVVLPKGNYCYATTCTIGSNTKLRGVAGASVLMPLGAVARAANTQPGQAIVNTARVNWWSTYENSGMSMPDFALAMAAHGDQNITLQDLTIDLSMSGMAFGGVGTHFFLASNVTIANVNVIGATYAGTTGPNFTACNDVSIRNNNYTDVNYNFEPWGGTRNVLFENNIISVPRIYFQSVTYGGPGDPAHGVWFNIVGSASGDDQQSTNVAIKNNTIFVNGSAVSANPVGIGIFPAGTGSVYRGFEISDNKIFCSGTGNWPIFAEGAGTNGHISRNLIDGYDGSAQSVIVLQSEPGNTAPSSAITSVVTVNGNTNITVNWPSHGYTGEYLSSGTVWFYAVYGPTVGGVAIVNYFRVLAVPNANSLTIRAQIGSTPTSSATAAWNGAFAQIVCAPSGVSVSGNRLINCQAPSGQPLILVVGTGHVVRDNDAMINNGASPAYGSLVSFANINDEFPGAAIDNTGPTGTGTPFGGAGNNRVSWNQYEPAPLVIDTDDLAGVLSVNGSAVVTSGGMGGAVITPTVGASPWTYTAPSRGTLYIINGTLTLVDIVRTSTIELDATTRVLNLAAGDQAIIGYSSAPTAKFFPA